MTDPENKPLPLEEIQGRIRLIRSTKVLLDRDLAELYGVPTKALKQAVRRNPERFPSDFMFELSREEWANQRSQFVTTDSYQAVNYAPMAFTEQGVAMLSSVLRSPRAIEVNIEIMRIFCQLRQSALVHEELARRLQRMETRYDYQFRLIFEVLADWQAPESDPPRPIGFQRQGKP